MHPETSRKLVHIGNGLWTLIVAFLSRWVAIGIIIIALLLCVFTFRPQSRLKWGQKLFNAIARDIDKTKGYLVGPTLYIIMVLVVITLVDYRIAAVCFAVLAFGDGVAALVGLKIGKHKIVGNKSLEGSLAFVIAAFIMGSFIFMLVDYFSSPDAGLTIIPALIVNVTYKDNLSFYFPYILGLMLAVSVLTALIELFIPSRIIDDNISIPFATFVLMWLGMTFFIPN